MKELITAAVLSAVLIAGTAHYNPAKADDQEPEGPSMVTSYIVLNKGVDIKSCMERAAYKLSDSGINRAPFVSDDGVYAQRMGYTAHMRCMIPKDTKQVGIVYFVVSGPDVKIASKIVDVLVKDF